MSLYALTHSPQSSTNRLLSEYHSTFLVKCVGCNKLAQFVCFVIYQQQLRHGSMASTNHMPLQPLTLTCQSFQCE